MFRPVSLNAFRFKPSFKRIISRNTATYEFKYYGDPDGPNFYLMQYLTLEYQKYEALKKSRSCSRIVNAIKSINSLDYAVQPNDVLTDITGVDQEIATMILSFFGKIRKNDFIRLNTGKQSSEPQDLVKTAVLNQLQAVNGIGPVKALILYNDGCRSIAQLKDPRFLNTLPTHVQELFVNEKELHSEVLYAQATSCKDNFSNVIDNQFDIHVVGDSSLKRPQINLLLFHPDYSSPPIVRKRRFIEIQPFCFPQPPTSMLHTAVLTPLREKGILVSTTFGGPDRWHGVIKIECNGEHLFRKVNIFFMPTVAKPIALRLYTDSAKSVCRYVSKALKDNLFLNDYGLWRPIDDLSTNKEMESKFSNLYYSLGKVNTMDRFFSRSSGEEKSSGLYEENSGLMSSHDIFYERLATPDEDTFFNNIFMEPSGSATHSSPASEKNVPSPASEVWNMSQYPPYTYNHLSHLRYLIKKKMIHDGMSPLKNRFLRHPPSNHAFSKRREKSRAKSRDSRREAGSRPNSKRASQ